MNKGGPGDLPERPQPGDLPPGDSRNPGGAKQTTNIGKESYQFLHAGHIVHVDTETMVCSVRLDSMQGERHDVPIPAPGGAGPRSWSGCIPEPFSKVIIGWKKFDASGRTFAPYIVEFLTPGTFLSHDYEPYSSANPEDAAAVLKLNPALADDPHMNLGVIRFKARKGYPGDYIASSSGGADIILDKDAFLTNRAGNEFRLRDADQTSILQVRNEFVSNAVGFYRRGLIKRNAFAFLPDLYPLDNNDVPASVISPGDPANGVDDNGEPLDRNPAYDTLLSFGLIKEDGTLNFQDSTTPAGFSTSAPSGTTAQPGDTGTTPFYPPIVTPDGQHISYITHGEHVNSMAATLLAYTEDRVELRHLSDGTMAVTEEGDGFQIDPPFPVFIEDVKGTYVGNDFHSDAGRPLYKRVLGMRLFSGPNQGTPSSGPAFEPVDTVQRLQLMDALGLARLFRTQCPYQDSSNQFVFGVTKEGKVLCHVPKTQVGEPDEKGKSIDLNVLGLIKAIIGGDENSNNQSIDLRTLGGINLEVGRFTGGANAGASIALTLHGGVKRTFNADPASGVANDDRYNGSGLEAGTGTKMVVWSGNYIVNTGGEFAQAGQKITLNAGAGGLINTVAGDFGQTILGDTQMQFVGKKPAQSTYAFGSLKTILVGLDSEMALVGGFARTVVAGSGITETVTAGNYIASVVAGNFAATIGTGNFAVTVAAGNLALTASAGVISLTSSLTASVISSVLAAITAPIVAIGAVTAGFGVAGIAGPPSPHIDYIVGIPILGVPTLTVGSCMPIEPVITLPIFEAALAANALIGTGTAQLAAGLANGLFQYLGAGVIVTSEDVGVLGAGTGIGPSVILPEPLILAALVPMMASFGLIGPMSLTQASAIAMGVSISLAGAIVSTINSSVGVGAGKLLITPTGTGAGIFASALAEAGLIGIHTPQLGAAIGTALDSVVVSAIGVIVIVGSPSIIPGAGVGIGKIIRE